MADKSLTSSYRGLRHIGEWFRDAWRPMCQVYGPMFGVEPGGRGRGKCRACSEAYRLGFEDGANQNNPPAEVDR